MRLRKGCESTTKEDKEFRPTAHSPRPADWPFVFGGGISLFVQLNRRKRDAWTWMIDDVSGRPHAVNEASFRSVRIQHRLMFGTVCSLTNWADYCIPYVECSGGVPAVMADAMECCTPFLCIQKGCFRLHSFWLLVRRNYGDMPSSFNSSRFIGKSN